MRFQIRTITPWFTLPIAFNGWPQGIVRDTWKTHESFSLGRAGSCEQIAEKWQTATRWTRKLRDETSSEYWLPWFRNVFPLRPSQGALDDQHRVTYSARLIINVTVITVTVATVIRHKVTLYRSIHQTCSVRTTRCSFCTCGYLSVMLNQGTWTSSLGLLRH